MMQISSFFVVDDYVNENFGREQEVCFEKDVIWNQNETENDWKRFFSLLGTDKLGEINFR